ncbi:translation initiation factor 2C-like protein, partial [Dinothrombium tinctorium]
KVNFRLGGINTILDYRSKPKYLKERTMVIGIDASHPSPTDRVSRSVAACVASFDDCHTRYFTKIMVQDPFVKVRVENEEKQKLVEEIVKINEMMKSILTKSSMESVSSSGEERLSLAQMQEAVDTWQKSLTKNFSYFI